MSLEQTDNSVSFEKNSSSFKLMHIIVHSGEKNEQHFKEILEINARATRWMIPVNMLIKELRHWLTYLLSCYSVVVNFSLSRCFSIAAASTLAIVVLFRYIHDVYISKKESFFRYHPENTTRDPNARWSHVKLTRGYVAIVKLFKVVEEEEDGMGDFSWDTRTSAGVFPLDNFITCCKTYIYVIHYD